MRIRSPGPRLRAAALLALLGACRQASAHPTAAERALVGRASGVWDAAFTLGETPRGAPDPSVAAPTPVRGTVALIARGGPLLEVEPLQHPATHTGVFDADFGTFGFVLPATGAVHAVMAAAVGPDSLVAMLPADGAGDGLIMRGTVAGDSVRGSWQFATRSVGGWSGTFVLHRRARDAR